MRIISSIPQIRKVLGAYRASGKSIGFVPTMGYLHEGHLKLVKQAKKEHDICVVSIYVNPTQFNPKEDLSKYPRDIKRDATMLRKENVDILFMPSDNDMYPNGYLTYVDVKRISDVLCGKFRPGHFKGVATIVTKLLQMVMPHEMYLGQKDAQQVVILKKVVSDLNIPVSIKVLPTVRESDGLAMSSRNTYLSPRERQEATVIYRALTEGLKLIKSGERAATRIIKLIKQLIQKHSSGKIQYVACVDAHSLEELKQLKGDVLIVLAAYFGKTRLIDNVTVRLNE